MKPNTSLPSHLVVLVDEHDNDLDVMEKYEAHQKGLLHRAISACLFNKRGEWLLQKRAATKYHSPGLVANSCCSHPFPSETPLKAATRRLQEELCISLPENRLVSLGSFIYREPVTNSLMEHELDHLFVGIIREEEVTAPEKEEVSELLWMSSEEIKRTLQENPSMWAPWFPHVFREVVRRLCNSQYTQGNPEICELAKCIERDIE